MALVVLGLIAVIAALVLSSPDEKGVTLQEWGRQNPADFVATAVTELDGTSTSASYGPPYNHAGTGQQIFFLQLQKWAGVHLPVDPAVDFVLDPLSTDTGDQVLTAALAVYRDATPTSSGVGHRLRQGHRQRPGTTTPRWRPATTGRCRP